MANFLAFQSGPVPGRFKRLQLHPIAWAFLLTLLFSCSSTKEETELKYSINKLRGQWFIADADSNTVLKGEHGLILAIPENAFLDSLGNPVKGKIHIRIREANTMQNIFASGLETRAGNKLLSTGGMYMIEAWNGGKNVNVNPGRGLYAFFPTDKKDDRMGLYSGEYSIDKLDWKLLKVKETSIPNCGASDPESKKKCKRCEHLVNKMAKMKGGKKPKKEADGSYGDDYWNERFYWENGVMYFFSSGASKPVLTQKEIDDCKDWLENSESGKKLLASVEKVKEEQKANVGDYYSYKLNTLGWYNIDRCVEKDLISFNGIVIDGDGKPVSGAKVHLLCTDPALRVHTYITAFDGTFTFEFIPRQEFSLYAYEKNKVGKTLLSLDKTGNGIARVEIAPIKDDQIDEFIKSLM